MGKYIDLKKLSVKDKGELRNYVTKINSFGINNKNPLPSLVSDFLLKGKVADPITNKETKIPCLPKKTGDIEKDKDTIISFFNELFDAFNGTDKMKENLSKVKDSNEVKFITDSISNNLSAKDSAMINNANIDAANTSTYTKYKAYADALVCAESRKKPSFWQIGERFNQWRERKSIERMEAKLKSLGVKQMDIMNAQRRTPTDKDFFEVQTNWHDILKSVKKELNQAQKYAPDDFRLSQHMKGAKEYIKHSMAAYNILKEYEFKACDKNNEFIKKDYNQFQKLLKGFDEQFKNDVEEDVISLDELKMQAEKARLRSKLNVYDNSTKQAVNFKNNEFEEYSKEKAFDLENADEKALDDYLENTL